MMYGGRAEPRRSGIVTLIPSAWRHGLIRQIAARLRLDILTLLLFLGVAAGVFIFMKLGSEVLEGEPIAIDRWLMLALREPADPAVPIGPDWVRQAMTDLTALGGGTVLTLATVAAAGYLFVARRFAMGLFVGAAVGTGALAASLLKLLFERARPDLVAHLVPVSSPSFPSGHAMNSAIVYLTLAALLARTEKDVAPRAYVMALALVLTLGIGVSRVYLGVHWPSDVVAGWCVGGAWAILASLIADRLQRAQAIEPES